MYILDFFEATSSLILTALGNGLWQGLVLVGLVWSLLRFIGVRRNLNATTRHAVWCVTLVVVVGLPLAMGALLYQEASPPVSPVVVALDEQGVPAAGRSLEVVSTTPVEAEPAGEKVVSVLRTGPAASMVEEGARRVEAAAQATRWQVSLPGSVGRWLPILFGVWLLIALALVGRVLRGWVSVQRLKRQSRPLPAAYQQRVDAWSRAVGLRRPIRIGGVEALATPVAAGLLRPMILVPMALPDQLVEDELNLVLLHELAHLWRRDDWIQLAQKLSEALFFFHPAVFWIGRQIEQEREMACDDWVVAFTRRPRSYASCLARLVELNVRARVVVAAPGMAQAGTERLFERVRRLLDRRRQVTARLSRSGLVTIVLALVAGFLLMTRLAPLVTLAVNAPEEEALAEPVLVTLEPLPTLMVESEIGLTLIEPIEMHLKEPVVARISIPISVPLKIPLQAPLALVETDLQRTLVARSEPAVPDMLIEPRRVLLESSSTIAAANQTLRQTTTPQGAAPSQDLSVASWVRVLRAAARIASDGDKARFLAKAVDRLRKDEQVYAAYIETARTISSSGDRKRVLSSLVTKHQLGHASLLALLDATRGLTSSGDRTRLLLQVARVLPDNEALRAAYLDVADTIRSSSDSRRVHEALR